MALWSVQVVPATAMRIGRWSGSLASRSIAYASGVGHVSWKGLDDNDDPNPGCW